MSVKDVLVHLTEDEGGRARLDHALAIAAACEAHLTALALVPEVVAPLVEQPPERQFRERRQAQADRLLAAAAERASRRGVALVTVRESGPLAHLAEPFVRRARLADLVLVGPPEHEPDSDGVERPDLTEPAFLATGRPALMVPNGAGPWPPRLAIAAWDGSRAATRALHDALPLLRQAADRRIAIVDAAALGAHVGNPPGEALLAHLRRHGVEATLDLLDGHGRSHGDILLDHAKAKGAGLLVMGGYGHARWRELVLGGTTRHILAHAALPVLLSH